MSARLLDEWWSSIRLTQNMRDYLDVVGDTLLCVRYGCLWHHVYVCICVCIYVCVIYSRNVKQNCNYLGYIGTKQTDYMGKTWYTIMLYKVFWNTNTPKEIWWVILKREREREFNQLENFCIISFNRSISPKFRCYIIACGDLNIVKVWESYWNLFNVSQKTLKACVRRWTYGVCRKDQTYFTAESWKMIPIVV